jgi:hypothetical protein
VDGKYFETIEGAAVMTQQYVERFINQRNRRFRWEAFLPKRKAWIQTLILLPFGLPVGNFLGASWNFLVNSIFEQHQYLIGLLSMAINLSLPSLFFACLFHWGWFIWKQEPSTWYPKSQALWAGAYATLTIGLSFGIVELLTHNLGICGNPAWGSISETLLCNLDGYGFESKSWFGAWFIIAAYCYQSQASINSLYQSIFNRQNHSVQADREFTSVSTSDDQVAPDDDLGANSIDSIVANSED